MSDRTDRLLPEPAEDGVASASLYQRLLDAIPDAVLVLGPDGRVLLLNQQAEALFGYAREEILGKPVELLMPARFRARHVGHRADYMRAPRLRPMGAELALLALHRDGSEFPVEISLSPVAIGGQEAVISTVRDISERQRAEAERAQLLERERASSARLQAIQRVMDVALAELTLEDLLHALLQRVREVLCADTATILLLDASNETLRARAALGLEEEVAQQVRIPVGAGFAGRVAAERRAVAVPDVAQGDIVNPILAAKGVRSLLGVPLLLERRLLGVLHVGSLQLRQFTAEETDLLQLVADRVALALDRARLYEEAQDAVRVRNEFLSAISHDLGNPVAAMRMQSRLLRRDLDESPVDMDALAEGLGQIELTAARTWGMVEELLDLARLQVGRALELHWRSADLAAIVRGLVAAQQAVSENHQLRLELAVPTISGDWDVPRLERVIANLLSNATKYSPAGGEIVVRLTAEAGSGMEGGWAILEVRDHGIGIPAADLPYIFDRFRRAGNVMGRFPGTGIGLAIAKRIVEQHGGTLTVQSQEGQGTTVCLRLPRGDAAE